MKKILKFIELFLFFGGSIGLSICQGQENPAINPEPTKEVGAFEFGRVKNDLRAKDFIKNYKQRLKEKNRQEKIDEMVNAFIDDPTLLLWTAKEIINPKAPLGKGRALDFEGMVFRAVLKAYGYPVPAVADEGLLGFKAGLRAVVADFIHWHENERNSDQVKEKLKKNQKIVPSDSQIKEIKKYVEESGKKPGAIAKTLMGGSYGVKKANSKEQFTTEQLFQKTQNINTKKLSIDDRLVAQVIPEGTKAVASNANTLFRLTSGLMLTSGFIAFGAGATTLTGILMPVGVSLVGVSLLSFGVAALFRYDYVKTLRFLKYLKERVVANNELTEAGLDQGATLDEIINSNKFTPLEALLLSYGLSTTRLKINYVQRFEPAKRGVRQLIRRIESGENPALGFENFNKAIKHHFQITGLAKSRNVSLRAQAQLYLILEAIIDKNGPFDAGEHVVFRSVMEAIGMTSLKYPKSKIDLVGKKELYRREIKTALDKSKIKRRLNFAFRYWKDNEPD